MSVKSNGDSTAPGVVAGSVTFPSTAIWPTHDSDNFYLYTSPAGIDSIHTTGCSVSFVNVGTSPFKSTPIITATISNATGLALTTRVSSVNKDGFILYVYNPTDASVSLNGALTVNWIAVEPTSGKSAEPASSLVNS